MKRLSSFFRMYVVDLILFIILFALGFYVKTFLAEFFQSVGEYQVSITALQAGLANQSTSALLAVDPLIGDLHTLVLKTFILALFVVPFLAYVLLVLSNAYLLSHAKKRRGKYFGLALLLGIPLLVLFYSTMDIFFQSFGNFLYSQSALILFLVLFFIFFLLSYCWYTIVAVRAYGSFAYSSVFYKKFFPLFFVFLLFYLLYLFLFFFLLYILIAVMTESFFVSQLGYSLVLFALLVVPLELVRIWYGTLLEKVLRKIA